MMRRRDLNCAALALVIAWGAPVTAWSDDALARETKLVRSKYPRVQQMQPAELAAWLRDEQKPKPVLLDVRTQVEYEVSHLPGARHVAPDARPAEVKATLDPARPVVVYCSVGLRSSALADKLMKAGVGEVFNLEGSIFAWANEGRPLERQGRPTAMVHPYNTTYGKMLLPRHRADVPSID